ncbi:hypothetical protein EC845_3430 [Comamonas sp. BIGb0124]|uniref:hypothetical protein n=1 Tax=Comamonas sp. BIGb0124 TaxID=2485130 RepID=UPI000F4A7C8A|nr:hypothetical protein [Comamonas sp. BIGb0124]ROR18458.1 hypothetical protein EC845_3430 [Comamonas sp. BIGb0124]
MQTDSAARTVAMSEDLSAAERNSRFSGWAFDAAALDEPAARACAVLQANATALPPIHRVLLASPDIALTIDALSKRLWSGALSRPVLEATFMVVARRLQCREQWERHWPKALAAGIPADSLSAIEQGMCPKGPNDVRLAWQLADRLFGGLPLTVGLRDEGLDRFGRQGMAEFCAFLGHATIVALTLNLQLPPAR